MSGYKGKDPTWLDDNKQWLPNSIHRRRHKWVVGSLAGDGLGKVPFGAVIVDRRGKGFGPDGHGSALGDDVNWQPPVDLGHKPGALGISMQGQWANDAAIWNQFGGHDPVSQSIMEPFFFKLKPISVSTSCQSACIS